jgi:ABC-type nitrate/sulfonate/bicarbonate transport system permease component
MLAALCASLLFTLTYATWAAKSRRAEQVLIPVLDVLQSVPVLGYLSFTAAFFVALAPHRALGAELAAIFAIFTSQAWNMAFSFYQALKTIPADLDEASRSVRQSAWQRFWRLEVPFAMPGLVWNTMMSMSGGWFFVVASEAISVGSMQIALPGVGSYVAAAIEAHDLTAVGYAIAAMTVAILLYDRLFFRPIVAWADRFRVEQTAASENPRSRVLEILERSRLIGLIGEPPKRMLERVACARLAFPLAARRATSLLAPPKWLTGALWCLLIAAGGGFAVWELVLHGSATFSRHDLTAVGVNGAITLLRVIVLTALASLIWVPIGVAVGLRPRWTAFAQPLAQFLAAFPAGARRGESGAGESARHASSRGSSRPRATLTQCCSTLGTGSGQQGGRAFALRGPWYWTPQTASSCCTTPRNSSARVRPKGGSRRGAQTCQDFEYRRPGKAAETTYGRYRPSMIQDLGGLFSPRPDPSVRARSMSAQWKRFALCPPGAIASTHRSVVSPIPTVVRKPILATGQQVIRTAGTCHESQ